MRVALEAIRSGAAAPADLQLLQLRLETARVGMDAAVGRLGAPVLVVREGAESVRAASR